MRNLFYILILILFLATFFSCKRNDEKITTDPQAKLNFSQSKITFDTIFSSIGSITKRLWVYNDNKHAVNISNIQLARLNSSSYTLTIDGIETLQRENYKLLGKDSMLILVKVLIDPQNKSLAYLVDDSILFYVNGNSQDVDLLAYGQDAFFFTNTTVPCNTTWTNTKPYVISGTVSVAPGCTLSIDKGTRILFHKNATLSIAGTLIAQGAKDSIIKFRHDNLSSYYNEVAGQWGGIIFQSGSKNNLISFAEIKNATNAIQLQAEIDGDTIAELTLENSVVKNCSENAVTASNTDFYAVNSLITNCAGYLFRSLSGGNYFFDFCTLTNYSYDFFRNQVAVRFSTTDSSSSNDLKATLRNTIVWGDKANEIELNNNGTNAFDVKAIYCMFATTSTVPGNNTLVNQDPKFENAYTKKFNLLSASPAVNSGSVLPSITLDLTGKTRDATPDRGCYEN